MKIIHEGRAPETKPVRARCTRCETQVEFLPGEAKYISDQRDGDFYQVNCPVCGHQITANVNRYNGPG